ncbi:MAG: hypothetical protein C0478_04180 [Planctomyces sp.]|nr:hypothetical protein [Planctomyces sp.]
MNWWRSRTRKAPLTACLIVGLTVVMSSCASWQNDRKLSFQSCPWPAGQQVREVLNVVPIGSTRADALKKLQKAGIQGNYGANDTIYYCDVWKREEAIWHINVALLFDEEGRVYATMPDASGQMVESPRTAREKSPVEQSDTPDRQNAAAEDPFLP